VVLLPTTVALGFWQLERAAQKEALELAYLERQAAPAVPLAQLDPAIPLQRVRFEGVFEPYTLLIDNQTRAGRVGYRVVTFFRVDDGRRFLIDRGWVEAPASRADLPTVETPIERVAIDAVLWQDMGGMPAWGETPDWPPGWPKRISRLNTERAAALLPNTVAIEIRLEGGQPGGFVPTTTTPVISAGTHYGYAVQWFGLALALVALFVVFGIRQARR